MLTGYIFNSGCTAGGGRGTGMKNLLAIPLFLSLSATAATPDKKPADCSPKQLAATEVLVGEHILVPVEYHGQSLWMALDLGEPFSVLWPGAVVREMALS